ncbi:MAG: peptide chain release factor N(5)-glutamine methyltransferase [Bacteroidetes bacterium]|nr:peptide chain release factor N(5)-glutamine methyltransferase [Bacteroidota bacterium]
MARQEDATGVRNAETVDVLWKRLAQALSRVYPDEARVMAQWLLEEATGISRIQRITHPLRPIAASERAHLDAMLQRVLSGEPLQYVVGHAYFRGLRLEVTPEVLIPRPETEQLVEQALERLPAKQIVHVLDVGTGSGCIALALKHERPKAIVVGCDVSEAALRVAQSNADQCGLPVAFVQADMRTPDLYERTDGPFDMVICNPPYVAMDEAPTLPDRVRAHEPALALFAEDEPLQYYRALAQQADRLLRPAGQLLVEINEAYGAAVVACFQDHGLSDVRLHTDYSGRDRFVVAQRPG